MSGHECAAVGELTTLGIRLQTTTVVSCYRHFVARAFALSAPRATTASAVRVANQACYNTPGPLTTTN